MRREDKIKRAKAEASNAKVAADHVRYFAFLDGFRPAGNDCTIGTWVDALAKEFGLDRGEAGAAHMHWMVLGHERHIPPEQRVKMMGGM